MVKTRQDTYWMNPVPLWSEGLEKSALPGQAVSNPPVILRFVTDWFMDEFNQLLATDPSRIAEYRVQQETWRGFSRPALPQKEVEQSTTTLRRFGIEIPFLRPAKTAVVSGKVSTDPLKLYQPAHQRFYLVTSSLICDTERLPDQHVNHGNHERVGFVIRRIWPSVKTRSDEDLGFPDSTWKEYAFTRQSDGSYAWNQVADSEYDRLQKNEETLPMFPVSYASECVIHGRRLWAGLVPVGKREAYMGAMAVSSPTLQSNPITPVTGRKVLFRTLVTEPWKSLVDTAVAFGDLREQTIAADSEDNPVPDNVLDERLKQTLELIQTTSWLIIADFRQYLIDYNRTVWDQVVAKSPGDLTGPKRVLYDALHEIRLNNSKIKAPGQTVDTLADALRQMEPEVVKKMELCGENFIIGNANPEWPSFSFPLADPDNLALSPQPVIKTSVTLDEDSNDDFEVNDALTSITSIAGAQFKTKIDQLAAIVIRALDSEFSAGEPLVPLAAMQPADLREGWFKIRCVYERPLCPVHCDPEIVSEPTEPFQMAGFFDPDAPARPIRIGLPLDTTASGLRKFNKNTAFVISDILCGQIKRFKKITFGDIVLSVLPWPFHKDLPSGSGGPCKKGGLNMGTICSLSIPIITLCAIILLIIMVTLFDFIFKWLPFFCLCFPIPGLKGKKK